jgi:hypothetical protein
MGDAVKRSLVVLAVGASCIALAGCGGSSGSGGVASTPTPTPTPPPPPPANSSITGLVASQTFSTDASTTNVAIDLASQTTRAATASGATISVAYDASAKSYTVTASGRSATFAPADVQSSAGGETRYAHMATYPRDYLTIVTTPYTGTTSNRYVALGYWQRNDVSGGSQSTSFDAFTFGLDTPAASVPRTGSASWTTDVFGLYTVPGQTPRTIQGSGDFTVNFAKALFTTTTYVTQYDFLTGASIIGGGVSVVAQGTIGSGNGFSGNLSYGGTGGAVSGTINGRFYGPNGEEIGAAFHADNAAGATLNGALTGQRNPVTTPTNFTIDSITSDQLFYSPWAVLTETINGAGTNYLVQGQLTGQTTLKADGSFMIGTPTSNMPSLSFTAADRIADTRANFASYQKTFNGAPVRVDLYRPSGGSGAIALTYVGFGNWSRTALDGADNQTINGYFAYGFATPRDLLARRTGTGTYDGVAIGTAGAANGARYDVGGTSHFDVDFTNQHYSGSLSLNATPEGGGTAAALGAWQFGAGIGYGQLMSATLTNGGATSFNNSIAPQLYGPDGEEIAAPFTIATGASLNGQNLSIAGVAAAKRH